MVQTNEEKRAYRIHYYQQHKDTIKQKALDKYQQDVAFSTRQKSLQRDKYHNDPEFKQQKKIIIKNND